MRLQVWRLLTCLVLIAVLAGSALAGAPAAGGPGSRASGPAAAQQTAPARAATPLRVAIVPSATRDLGEELVGAWLVSAPTANAATTRVGRNELVDRLKAGDYDVVLGACASTTKKVVDAGLLVPESNVTLFWLRLAVFVPAGNPKAVYSAADLDRSGLRLGLCTWQTSGAYVEALKAKVKATEATLDPLLDRLQAGQLDAVVAMDSGGRLRPELVTLRLPRSVAGEESAVAVHGFAVRGTKQLAHAEALLQFCDSAQEADRVKLTRGLLTSNGDRAADYSKEAGPRMMPSYISVAKQVAEDYAKGAKTCLDLGCGPGHMTVEVAKVCPDLEVTGLDIEPEAIDFAVGYAKQCGLDARLHWVAADVHALPYSDNSFDLVISRGSIFFWRDQATALREIMRVLKPGGYAFLGGGSGRSLTAEEATKTRQPSPRNFHFPFPLADVPVLMARAGIADYRHLTDGGSWLEFRKPAAPAKAG